MAGKTGATCSPAAPLSRPANASRPAKRPAEPPERPGKHKRSTRGAQESNTLSPPYPLACTRLVPRLRVALAGLCPAFQLSGFHPPQCWYGGRVSFQVSSLIPDPAFCIRPGVALSGLALPFDVRGWLLDVVCSRTASPTFSAAYSATPSRPAPRTLITPIIPITPITLPKSFSPRQPCPRGERLPSLLAIRSVAAPSGDTPP